MLAPLRGGHRHGDDGCHAVLKSRTCAPSFSTLSAFSLQSHCTEITDICSQIANDVSEKVRPWFECNPSKLCLLPLRLCLASTLANSYLRTDSMWPPAPLHSVRDLSTNTLRNPRFECTTPCDRTKVRDLSDKRILCCVASGGN